MKVYQNSRIATLQGLGLSRKDAKHHSKQAKMLVRDFHKYDRNMVSRYNNKHGAGALKKHWNNDARSWEVFLDTLGNVSF